MEKRHDKTYLLQLQKRYQKTRKAEKKIILDEFTKTTGYDRKHAGKLIRGSYKHKVGKISRPHKRKYCMLDAIILSKVCNLLDWNEIKRKRKNWQ